MKIREFVELYNERNMDTKCEVCKKELDQNSEDTVSDHDGNLYHKKCFDKKFGNEELKKRRTDNQLPYDY
jgi:hypothetical protein